MSGKKVIVFLVLAVLLVFYVFGILQIQPTFDDFTTLSAPNTDPDWLTYFLPIGTIWRPVDTLIGYINGSDIAIFPTLNHLIVIFAHLSCTYLVYRLAKLINISGTASAIAALFFFISPCMLGTVLSVDATNQSLCQLFGLLSVYVYLTNKGRSKYILWIILVFLSAFSKENGITFACIVPVLSFVRGDVSKKQFIKQFIFGLIVAVIYGIIHIAVPNTPANNTEHLELMTSIPYKFKAIATWLGYTWSATDYICIFFSPQRNWLIVAITFLISAPIMILAFLGNRLVWRRQKTWLLVFAIIISASANLLIEMSIMNTYCSLAMSSLLFGYLIDEYVKSTNKVRVVAVCMSLYVVSAIFVDIHHWYNAWQTSLPSKTLSESIIKQSHHKAQKAYVITIKDKNPKYSSFCVPVQDVTGWGRDVWRETDYTWPTELNDTTIDNTPNAPQKANRIADNKLKSNDAVWIIYDANNVKVMEKVN